MRSIIFGYFFIFANSVFAKSLKIEFWNQPRKGTNFFNQVETKERLVAAKDLGLDYIRLAPNKWKATDKDFLIGNADAFTEINTIDFQSLKTVLDIAKSIDLKVVITMLSTPGCRWAQQNGDVYDKRLWRNFKYHNQTAEFWRQLALLLKDHPAVIGYDVINEPAPERSTTFQDWYLGDYLKWYSTVEGTPADLNKLYSTITTAIRSVDQNTPIILETGFYATPWAIKYLKKTSDERTLYSVHMYEPYSYTNFQQTGEFVYPGPAPIGESDNRPVVNWDKAELSKFFEPIRSWMAKSKLSKNSLLVGEFGVFRQHKGADKYLSDLIEIFKTDHWHWAFYSFREDTWPGMDYELGNQALSAEWREAFERGENPPRSYKENKIFNVIKQSLSNPK